MSSRTTRRRTPVSRCAGAVALATTLVTLLAAATPGEAGPINVLAHFRLGDADPGAALGNTIGSTIDSSPSAHLLTTFGNPTYVDGWPHVPDNFAAAFDGNDSFTGSFVPTGTDNFALEAWIRPTNAIGGKTIAYNGRTDTSGYGLYQDGDQLAYLYGGNVLQNVATLVLGQWVHLALVRDSGTTNFFVDGTLAFSSFDFPNSVADPASRMIIGANHLGTENFIGDISEVRLSTFAPGAFQTSDLLTPVPEPATMTILGIGLGGVVLRRYRRGRSESR